VVTNASPRQPVHGGKNSGTGIALQQGDELSSEQVLTRARYWWMADSSKEACAMSFSPRQETSDETPAGADTSG
jgi:hypothetical protein